MSFYQHILVATDLSDNTAKILKTAREFAERFAARLSFIHVVEPLVAFNYGFGGIPEVESQLLINAQEALSKLVKPLNISPQNQHVVLGHPKIKIVELARELKVDAIIVGTHGRHGISLLLGSTANSIAHNADCDVIMIRISEKSK